MVTKNDFSASEWNNLRDTQYLVGFATVMAGSSGLGTIKELIALSQGIIENQSSDIPLIRDLTSKGEMEAAQNSLRQSMGGVQSKPSPDMLRQRAIDQAKSCVHTLETRAGKQEADAYRRMLYNIAERVANAAREGGFFGFGGQQVSDAERSFLDELRNALHIEQVSKA